MSSDTSDFNLLLYDKIANEFDELIESAHRNFFSETPSALLNTAYEIVFKAEMVTWFENGGELSQTQAEALYRLKNPLNTLFAAWQNRDETYMDRLEETIKGAAEYEAKKERNSKAEENQQAKQTALPYKARSKKEHEGR